jgi:hypothetical protein
MATIFSIKRDADAKNPGKAAQERTILKATYQMESHD